MQVVVGHVCVLAGSRLLLNGDCGTCILIICVHMHIVHVLVCRVGSFTAYGRVSAYRQSSDGLSTGDLIQDAEHVQTGEHWLGVALIERGRRTWALLVDLTLAFQAHFLAGLCKRLEKVLHIVAFPDILAYFCSAGCRCPPVACMHLRRYSR